MATKTEETPDRLPPVPLNKPSDAVVADDGETKFEKETGLPIAPERVAGMNELIQEPPALKDYKGTYRKKDDGLVYALAVTQDDVRGRTHHARNTQWQWNGTKAEFEAQFVKE